MRLSKHALTVLNAQYRSVLKKCLLINAGVFMAFSANAAETITGNFSNDIFKDIYIEGAENNLKTAEINDAALDRSNPTSDYVFNYADVKITNSDMETNGNITISNSNLSVFCTGQNCGEQEEDGEIGPGDGFLGYDVTINDSTITMGEQKKLNDMPYFGANHDFNINHSEVVLNGGAVFAYEGDKGGVFEISNGSNIILNDNAELNIGERSNNDNDEETEPADLIISNSYITLNDKSTVQFLGNKGKTTVTKSEITLNDKSSMHLNDLALNDSKITITNENATLEVTDVQLNNSAILGQNNVVTFKGDVEFSGLFDPAKAIVDGNVLTRKLADGGYDDDITWTITKGTLKYDDDKILYEKDTHGDSAKYALNSINFNGGRLDLVNGKASEIKLASLNLSKNSDIMLDVDLANQKMDTLTSNNITVDNGVKLNISKLNLVSDAEGERTTVNFTGNKDLASAVNYDSTKSELTKEKALSPIYTYDVAYDNTKGDFTFTRGAGVSSGDYNPSVYAGSVVGQTLATIQSTIAQTAFSSLKNSLPQKDNAWVSVIGFDDTVDMKSFNNVDSEMYSVVGGVNSDVKNFNDFDATYGLYAGYINSEQKYSGNKINQNGGYVGLDSVLNRGNAELLASVNTGYIRNEDKHSFGNDKFDTYFTGVALKAGYTYDLDNGLSVVPSLYAGYTFVNNEDYTSKSGVKIKNDNLHLFEVAPGVKVNKDFNNGWTGYAQAKYAFIMDNGGDADVNNINLPNISAKDYVEYGLGANKALNDSWSLSAEINRRDGGREGWNGNLNVKYNF